MNRTSLVAAALAATIQQASSIYTNGSVTSPCDSPIYCYGELLHEVELARPFADSKTFVDLPTIRPLDEVLAAFANLSKPLSNNTELQDFLTTYFGEAGGELAEIPPEELTVDPTFLENVDETIIREFLNEVIGIWPDLTRRYNSSARCEGCVDSFIPIERPFVVAGGRFREPYYWDSYWVIEGLLRTQGSFTGIALNIIENFLDLVDQFGFVPNGARVYYLNRSQPPLLTQMVRAYVEYTNDTSILERAVPLLIKEYDFWTTNRTVDIEAYGTTYTLNRYNVNNNQPRPESYREDYITATNTTYVNEEGEEFPVRVELNEEEQATLYGNLASGAESGWDYSSRWLAHPEDDLDGESIPLRSLNTAQIIPVDLNSILYGNEIAIANFLTQSGDSEAAAEWEQRASQRSQAMYDLMFNQRYWGYFDYNLTSGEQNLWQPTDNSTTEAETEGAPEGQGLAFSIAQFYPFWTGAVPAALQQNPAIVKLAYQRVANILDNKPGAIGATNLRTTQQWDEPNVWPPLQDILVQGLLNTPPTGGEQNPDYQWVHALALRLAQRYIDSTYCTWRSTGGSSPSNPAIEGAEGEGIMFEKYSEDSINVAGGGGEYEVVEGFGWSNGVLITFADKFAKELKLPECGDVEPAHIGDKRAVQMDASDMRKVKRIKSRN